MKLNKISLALGLASAVVLTGCGGGSSSSSDSNSSGSSTYSVTAIDGYLNGALVWLDIDGDFEQDDNEPSATSGAGGVANLDVSNVTNPSQYAVVVKAIPGQTVDEDNGPVETGYVMSAPAGETDVTPLSTLVHVILEQTTDDDATEEEIEQAKEDAVQQVADDLGIDADDVLGDFIEDDLDDAAFAAETIVEQNVLPDDEEDLGDAADGTDDSLLESADSVSSSIKTVNDSDPEDYDTIDVETDSDSDGVPDILDAFDNDPNEQYDLDGDGTGDNADTDDDGDTYLDTQDEFPTDGTEWADADKDNIGDNADLDDDNDGVNDTDDEHPNDDTRAGDSDGDGTDDLYDEFPDDPERVGDSDGDGVDSATDEYPGDPTRAGDSDGDGVDDLDDEFPDDNTQAGDADGDGVDGLQDAFPGDPNESVDTDLDGIGNNADPDDDDDGVDDQFDSAPLDDTVVESGNRQSASFFNSLDMAFIFDGDIEDGYIDIETLEIANGMANLTSIATLNSFGEFSFDLDEDSGIVLTATGWQQLDGLYTIDFSDGEDIYAYATNFESTVSYTVSATLTDLEGSNVSDYANEDEIWDEFTDTTKLFSKDAKEVEATLTPEDDIYQLWEESEAYVFQGDGGATDGKVTDLDELITDISVNTPANTGDLVGVYLSGDGDMAAAVELLDDNTAHYYLMDWTEQDPDMSATRVATGTWSGSPVAGVELIEFTVPEAAITAWGGVWDEDNTTFIFAEYDGVVRQGHVEKAGEALEDDEILFVSEVAKEDIVGVLDLPLGECHANDVESGATNDDFLLAIAGCGGLESAITSDMLVGNTFERERRDDSTRQYTFVEGGTVHVGKNGLYSFDAAWAIDGDFLVITFEDGNIWKWALVGKETEASSAGGEELAVFAAAEEDSVWSVKHFETYTNDAGVLVNSIWSETFELIDEAVCGFDEVESDATQQTFDDAIAEYETCTGKDIVTTDDDVRGLTLMRTNSRGEVRATEFDAEGNMGTYYRNTVMSGEFAWSIVDGNKIVLSDSENASDVWDQYVILSESEGTYLIADFVPEDGEIWTDTYTDVAGQMLAECEIGNTEWDDVNDVPLTTGSFEEYLEAVEDCREQSGVEAYFSGEFFDRDDRTIEMAVDDEKYSFESDGTGTYSDIEEGQVTDTYSFTWTVDTDNDLIVVTITAGEITAIDYLAIVDTNGKALSVKAMSKANATGWPGIGADDEGDIWGDVFELTQVFHEE